MSAIWYSYSKSLTARSPRISDRRVHAAREIHEQALELANLDARLVANRGANELHPLLDREQRLLGDVDGDGDDEAIDESETAADEVLVAARDRVERAGVEGDSGHGAGEFGLVRRDAQQGNFCRRQVSDVRCQLSETVAVSAFLQLTPDV